MNRYCLILLGVLLGLCQIALCVEDLSVIYDGEKQLPKRLNMGFWGYRPIRESELNPFEPVRLPGTRRSYGLHIVTYGRYEGVRFDFLEPLDISSYLGEKSVFLEVYLRAAYLQDAAQPTTPGNITPPMQPPYGGMPPPPYGGGMPNRGMPNRGMAPYGDGTQDDDVVGSNLAPPVMPGVDGVRPPGAWDPNGTMMTPGVTPPQPDAYPMDPERKQPVVPMPALKNIRLTLYTDKGEGLLVVTPDQFYPKDEIDKTWVRIGIPLSTIKQQAPLGGKLYRVMISSDEPTEFLVGRMAIVRDDDPIEANMFVYPPFLEAKQSIFLMARVKAGLTPYDVDWDFDTEGGNSVDASGERVTYTYAAEGLYKITCTVRDKTGGKPPITSEMDVKISRPYEE